MEWVTGGSTTMVVEAEGAGGGRRGYRDLYHRRRGRDGHRRAYRRLDQVQDGSTPGAEDGAAGAVCEVPASHRAVLGRVVSHRSNGRARDGTLRRCRQDRWRNVDRMGEDLDGDVHRRKR